MPNNTTGQTIVKGAKAAVIGNVPVGYGVLASDVLLTLGTFVCNGATPVTVTEPTITANSSIVVTLKTVGGTVGAVPAVKTITPGTGFTIAGTASDTSVYNYLVIA